VDVPVVRRHLVTFLRSYLDDAKASGYVLGVSGGVDSAVVAALAVEAVGPERVLGLLLPHRTSHADDAAHALLVCEALKLPHERVDVTPIVEAVEHACVAHPLPDGMARFNVRPRARMMVLYAHAAALGALDRERGLSSPGGSDAAATGRLVLATGNKSELLTGYFTKWGDGAGDVYPLGDVYKTDVWALARELRLPDVVVAKPPTAGLFAGQTDESELGIRYQDLDKLLAELEAGHDLATAARRAGVPLDAARAIEGRIVASAHKRNPLVIPKVGFRTPGWDWREPRHRSLGGASGV
jgi:NAD+ synthase